MYYSMNLLGHIKAHTVYILSEKSKKNGYGAERFIPCAGATGDELVEETEMLTL
jgi:translation elongation factor EF-1alpha